MRIGSSGRACQNMGIFFPLPSLSSYISNPCMNRPLTWYLLISDDCFLSKDELNLLRDPEIKSHPNVVNLIGFQCEKRLAVIYEGGSVELLHKIIPNDTFSWKDRMKVATDIASMLEAFHNKGLVHGGLNSKNIMVDKEKCPVVFDSKLFSYCEDREEYEQYIQKFYHFHNKHQDVCIRFCILCLLFINTADIFCRYSLLVHSNLEGKFNLAIGVRNTFFSLNCPHIQILLNTFLADLFIYFYQNS